MCLIINQLAIVLLDFAENYSFVIQDEVQGFNIYTDLPKVFVHHQKVAQVAELHINTIIFSEICFNNFE